MINLNRILKSKDITLPAKVHLVKSMVFPIVMYGCESWTVKKVEHQRTDAFKLWCWRRFLRVPWTARSNQSMLKEINHEYWFEGLMLKLKLQCFGYLIWIADSLQKTLMLGKIEDRRREWQRRRQLDAIINSMDKSLSKLWDIVKDREARHAVVHGVAKISTWLCAWQNQTELSVVIKLLITLQMGKAYCITNESLSLEKCNSICGFAFWK